MATDPETSKPIALRRVGDSSASLSRRVALQALYLMDHTWVAGGASGEFPDAPAPKPSLGAPRRPNGVYTIRMKNTISGAREKKYVRVFGFQGGGSTSFRMNAPGYGAAFKKAVLDPLTSVNLVGFGEVLPRFDNV